MVRALWCVGLLLLVLVPQPAIAEDLPEDWLLVFEDPTGDLERGALSEAFAAEGGDLKALWIQESEDALGIRVQLASLEGAVQTGVIYTNPTVTVPLLRGEREWSVNLYGSPQGWQAYLRYNAPNGGFVSYSIPLEQDDGLATLTVQIPRARLTDHEGLVLSRLAEVTLGTVSSRQGLLQIDLAEPFTAANDLDDLFQSQDRMPDQGAEIVFKSVFGPPQEGPIYLFADQPYRTSNGEATTYLFEVDVRNPSGDSVVDANIRFLAESVPTGWQVHLPVRGLRFAEDTKVPVLLTVPLRHEHGALESFSLVLEGESLHSEVALGVLYADPAHWSGHHPTIRIYPGGWMRNCVPICEEPFEYASGYPVMTTEVDPEWAAPYPMRSTYNTLLSVNNGEANLVEHRWWAPISGGLQMGMDFEPGTGSLDFLLEFSQDMLQTTVEVELLHFTANRTPTMISRAGLDAQNYAGRVPFHFDLPVHEGVDTFPYEEGSYLGLGLYVKGFGVPYQGFTGAAPVSPELVAGAELTMPLKDYHDPVEAVFADLSPITVSLQEANLEANPGDVVVFRMDLRNGASEDAKLRVEVQGERAWIVGDEVLRMRLEGAGSTEILVGIEVPDDARDDHVETFSFEVYEGSELLDLAQGRVSVVSEEDLDVPDEADVFQAYQSEASKDAPVASLLIVLLGLLALASRRR